VGCRFPATGGGFGPVDLDLFSGQRIGLTGPNGCGKSSLLAVAAGLRRPDSGSCFLGQRRLYRDSEVDLDHGAALLAPQFPEYFFTRTRVKDEVELDPALARLDLPGILAWAGLPPGAADRNPYELSSGQRRRLAVALVLLSGRPLLLLDEPTACLDNPGRARLLELLAEVPADAAIVVASHDADFLAAGGFTIHELGPEGLKPNDGHRR
jgi:energy-coupling factor transporter ATP-binding protein EcfA2